MSLGDRRRQIVHDAGVRRLAVLLVLTAAAIARAHVAPSLDDNNRYVKLTPLGDRVRLAYTVYFGEVPGAAMRREIDADHDGKISDAESRAFAAKLGEQVRGAVDVTIDGAAAPVAWEEVDVGMQDPVVAGGSFSVDLIAWLCLPSAGGAHALVLRDRFALPRPGENELRVEDTPGVHVDRARLGEIDLVDLDARWQGAGGPLATAGFTLAFTAGEKAPVLHDGACVSAKAASPSGSRLWIWIVVVGIGAIAAGVLGFVVHVHVHVSRARSRGTSNDQRKMKG
jgi:hypothetical protein